MLRVSFSDSFAAICSLSAHCWSRTAGSVVHLSMVVLLVGGGLAPTVGESGEVLEFSGPGCLACQRMSPLVEKLKRQGYPIRVLDIRRAPRLARQLDIKLLPTFVLIESGRAVKKIVGVTSESQLRSLVESARASSNTQPDEDPGPSVSARLTEFAGTLAKPPGPKEPVVRAKAGAATLAAGTGLQSSCVRLRLEQTDGHEFASGTIIDSRPGRSIVLTCGHLFRNYHPRGKAGGAVGRTGAGGRLTVEVFDGRRSTSYAGRLLGHDLESDVGLVEIASRKLLPVARVADPGESLSAGQRLVSFGCNGGDQPTRELVAVTRLNRYLGPDNIECTGVPLQGRSGGGLFDGAGRVVGVCFAADPTYQRGLYAGLKPIHDLLVRCRLNSLVAHRDQPGPNRDAIPTAARTPVSRPVGSRPSLDDFPRPSVKTVAAESASPVSVTEPGRTTPVVPPRSTSGRSRGVSQSAAEAAASQAAVFAAEGAEVVCIIRSSDNPRAASRVVIINRASRKFVSDLLGEVDAGARPTSRFEARTTRRPHPVVGHTRAAGPSRMRLPVIRGGGFSVRPGSTR
ncbi:MAG: trypsin-like peptidase domain-containing protein [Planctomycetota bacterium]|nr:trypsin-like peptidase domain-containing protein [Planctomycetota bacterium]